MANITKDITDNSQAILDQIMGAKPAQQPTEQVAQQVADIQPHHGQPSLEEYESTFCPDHEHLVSKDLGVSKIYANTQMLQTRISKELNSMTVTQINASLNARKVYNTGKEKIFTEIDTLEQKLAEEMDQIKEDYIGAPASAETHALTSIISISEQLMKAGNETDIYNALHGTPELRRNIAQYLKVFGSEGEKKQMLKYALDALVSDHIKSDQDYKLKEEVKNSLNDIRNSFMENLEDQVGSKAISFFKTGQLLQQELEYDQKIKDQQLSLDEQQKILTEKLKQIKEKKKELKDQK
jgi:hypothetical protein